MHIDILAEHVFNQAQPRFHITVDELDEHWVSDPLRYRLIKALIETARDINNQLKSVKVLIAIRRDLFDRVFQEARDPGFQEEKYTPSLLDLRWSKDELFSMLDRRVNKLVRRQYTQASVGWRALMPKQIQAMSTEEFLVERTMYRPRDLIVFFNFCIAQAVDFPEITPKMVIAAEAEYSEERLRSLRDEWDVDYPELLDVISIIKQRPHRFKVDAIPLDAVADLCLASEIRGSSRRGVITSWASQVFNETMRPVEFRAKLLSIFYRVGLVGLKLETFQSDTWAFRNHPTVGEDLIQDSATVVVCPVFYRCLGIYPSNRSE